MLSLQVGCQPDLWKWQGDRIQVAWCTWPHEADACRAAAPFNTWPRRCRRNRRLCVALLTPTDSFSIQTTL